MAKRSFKLTRKELRLLYGALSGTLQQIENDRGILPYQVIQAVEVEGPDIDAEEIRTRLVALTSKIGGEISTVEPIRPSLTDGFSEWLRGRQHVGMNDILELLSQPTSPPTEAAIAQTITNVESIRRIDFTE